MTRRRSTLLVLGGLLAASAVTIGAVSPASGDDGNRKVGWTQTSPNTAGDSAFIPDVSRCNLVPPTFLPAEPCVTPIAESAAVVGTVTGDFSGTSRFGDAAIVGVFIGTDATAPDLPFVQYSRFVGSVAGCGSGSVILQADGNTNTTAVTWKVVPRSGRGDLTGISGSGTAISDFSGPGGTAMVRGTGRIRCGKHAHD